jgi:Na+-driven multidrug efflux pump
MTTTYLKWLLVFSPAFIFNNIFICFLRNDEAPQLSMMAVLFGSFTNIIFDYIFIFPMNMGILGAVLATGTSPAIGILLMSKHWRDKKNSFHLVKERLYVDSIKQPLSLGFPSLIGQLAAGITMIVFNFLILALEGNIGVAAYGVVANISIVIIGIFNGIAEGVQPLVADNYGLGKKKEIRSLHKYSMCMMTLIAIVIYAAIYIFADPITSMFNSEQNIKLQELAVVGLRLYFTSMIVAGYNIVITVFFTSTERALPAQVLTLLRGFILIIPLSFLMAKLWGMNGIWLTFPVAEFIVAVIGWVLYSKKSLN